jgi:TPR repeat protein
MNQTTSYEQGHNALPQDYAEAAKWLRKAADQGESLAQDDLGAMYYNGWGVPQDYAEAAKWYHQAADRGSPAAQISLGVMYEACCRITPKP